MAEHRIAEMSGYGIVCFISNYSWLDGLSFTGMRESYLEKFDRVWIDCLNGDKYKTGKLTPDGKPDPSVFSTEWNREGIQVGTAVGLLVKKQKSKGTGTVHFEHFWGKNKRDDLLKSLDHLTYTNGEPKAELGLSFLPAKVSRDYNSWPALTELFPASYPGVKTSRDKLLIDFDKQVLIDRIKSFFDPEISYQDWRTANPDLAEKTNRFDPEAVREYLVNRGYVPQNIVRYQYRPFDVRWLYWEPETKLLDEKRSEYFPLIGPENVWFTAGQRNRKEDFYRPQFTRLLTDHHIVESNVGMFPLMLNPEANKAPLYEPQKNSRRPNLSELATKFLQQLGCKPPEIFYSSLASLNSPKYTAENAGALRQDWPRVPLPDSKEVLANSASLGRQIATFFDTESSTKGVTAGDIRPELKLIAVTARAGGGNLKESDLALTAGWGHAGKGGVTMPGKGKLVEREYSPAERKALLDGANALGLSGKQLFAHLGDKTCDVYLNDTAYWSNVPSRVWEYTIGGYQVIKKWLSYREQLLLGRPLTKDEVRYVQEMARRIAAIRLLEPALDANYESIKQHTFPWPPK